MKSDGDAINIYETLSRSKARPHFANLFCYLAGMVERMSLLSMGTQGYGVTIVGKAQALSHAPGLVFLPVADEPEALASPLSGRPVTAARRSGKGPQRIAANLNRGGFPSPTGGRWADTTIRGSRAIGSGFLNCKLYVGRLVWNRQR